MLEAGFLVALGLLLMLGKMPWRWKMRVISHPLLTDAIVFVMLIAIHWGTFSGVMAATVGALICSMVLGIAKRTLGYIDGKTGRYVRGFFDVSNRITS